MYMCQMAWFVDDIIIARSLDLPGHGELFMQGIIHIPRIAE